MPWFLANWHHRFSADFARLGEQIGAAEQAGVEYIHVDVIDGHFVPNITIGPLLVETLKRVTQKITSFSSS